MSSFKNFFDENFLLSSTLKPKNSTSSSVSVEGGVSTGKDIDSKDILKSTSSPFILENKGPAEVQEPLLKRACVDPSLSEASKKSSISVCESVPPASTSHSLPDQILQIRIKLQIYQKEYAHFVECANRSSLQIQETLEELHRLVNLNYDAEVNPMKPLIIAAEKASTIAAPAVDPEPVVSSVSGSRKAANKDAVVPELVIKSVKHRPRAFPRKPRCLIFNPTSPAYSDMMVTSSLDGSLQIWSKSEQKIQTSLYLPSYLNKPFFVEDLCWDRRPSGILALGLCESSTAPVSDEQIGQSGRSDRQMAFLVFNNRDPFASPKFISTPLAPHERSVSVVESWSSSKHSSNSSCFLTGGLDKAVYSWKISFENDKIDDSNNNNNHNKNNNNDSDPVISVKELHRRHTSSVQAICFDWNKSDIWSGGTDCRLVQWNAEENRIVNEYRWENRISHLIKTKNHPNLILATVMAMSAQLRLFDPRANAVIHSFGTQETANLSRYVRPSWHLNGNLIANGTLSPADSIGSINIWDLRMMKGSNPKPSKVINCEDRRLVRAEFAPDGQSLVGMSTDGFMTFVDFTT